MGPGFSISNSYVNKKPIYENEILKKALLNQNFTLKQIDDVMLKMKISSKTPITKDLINKILQQMK